jgi:hypothetical protein
LWLDFSSEIALPARVTAGRAKPLEFKHKDAVPPLELKAKLERLLEVEKCSLEQAAAEVGVSLTTVRRIVRTLAPHVRGKGVHSRSSQAPFGWVAERGMLRELAQEIKWVRLAQRMRAKGESYHSIARYLSGRGVPTKNGGWWHAKTISQILDFNSRMPIRPKRN